MLTILTLCAYHSELLDRQKMREEKKKDAAEAKAKQARPTGTAIALVEDANVDFNTAIAIALVDLRSPATHNRWG
jgi:hypothetical protein